MAKKELVQIVRLTSLYNDPYWQNAVESSVDGGDGLTLSGTDTGNPIVKELECSELEFYNGEMKYHNFSGRGDSFYECDYLIFVEKATGLFWTINADELYDF